MGSSFEGVYAAALTPLRDDLAIDRRAFAEHCRRLLGEGCDGLAIFGTTGEANSFSVAERVRAWEALVADGVPAGALLPGTGACALTDAVTLTREALAAGAPGGLALPPVSSKGRPRAPAVLLQGRLRGRAVRFFRRADRARRRRPAAAVPLPHPAADDPRVLVRADRPAAGRLPGRDRRPQGLQRRRRADRVGLPGVPAAAGVRRHRSAAA